MKTIGRAVGLSLVEVLVVGVLTAVAFLGAARIFQVYGTGSVKAKQQDSANELIEQLAADIRKTNFYFVLAADSGNKNGVTLTSRNTGQYYVKWTHSQMRSTLEAFEQAMTAAGFTRFVIDCKFMFRYDIAGGGLQDYFGFGNNPAQSPVDSRMFFRDRNSDGDYYEAIFDGVNNRWVPEVPDVSTKDLRLFLYKGDTLVAEKNMQINLGDSSPEEISFGEANIRIRASYPTGPFVSGETAEQQASLNLALRKPYPQRIPGLPACRERRMDSTTDGRLVVHGQTRPGAEVKAVHNGSYWDRGGPLRPIPNREETFRVTSLDGVFTHMLNMTPTILGDLDAIRDRFGRSVGLQLTARLDSSVSQIRGVTYNMDRSTTPPSVEPFPEDLSVVRTLAPGIGVMVQSVLPLDTTVSALYLDDVEKNSMVSGTNPSLHMGIAIPCEPGNRDCIYKFAPLVLEDNRTYSVLAEVGDTGCYKAKASWTFRTDLGVPGPSTFDDTPPVITILSPAEGGTVDLRSRSSASLRFTMEDPESGIDYRTLKVFVGYPGGATAQIQGYLWSTWGATPFMPPVNLTLDIRHFGSLTEKIIVQVSHFSNDPADPSHVTGSAEVNFTVSP
jgi:hypothetical protein